MGKNLTLTLIILFSFTTAQAQQKAAPKPAPAAPGAPVAPGTPAPPAAPAAAVPEPIPPANFANLMVELSKPAEKLNHAEIIFNGIIAKATKIGTENIIRNFDGRFFIALEHPNAFRISALDGVQFLEKYYQSHGLREDFLSLHRRAEKIFFAMPVPKLDDKERIRNYLDLGHKALSYYLREDILNDKAKSLVNNPVLFAPVPARADDNYKDRAMVQVAAFRRFALFDKANAALAKLKPQSTGKDSLINNWNYYMESVDISIGSGKLDSAEKKLTQILNVLPPGNDKDDHRFWAEVRKIFVLIGLGKYPEALALQKKCASYGSFPAVTTAMLARNQRMTRQGAQAARTIAQTKDESDKGMWTPERLWPQTDIMVAAIYAKDAAMFEKAANNVVALSEPRKGMKTHDGVPRAWYLIGSHVLMKKPLDRNSIEAEIKRYVELSSETHPDVTELRAFMKTLSPAS
jgi:hypothetical protein